MMLLKLKQIVGHIFLYNSTSISDSMKSCLHVTFKLLQDSSNRATGSSGVLFFYENEMEMQRKSSINGIFETRFEVFRNITIAFLDMMLFKLKQIIGHIFLYN